MNSLSLDGMERFDYREFFSHGMKSALVWSVFRIASLGLDGKRSWAALIKPRNNGCGFPGRERNSGWYWQAVKNGCSGSSINSTRRPSGELPLMR